MRVGNFKISFTTLLIVIAVIFSMVSLNKLRSYATQIANPTHKTAANKNNNHQKQDTHTTTSNSVVDWRGPSENKPYPDVNKYPNMWVKVSTTDRRVYLMDDKKVLYTMLCSPGAKGQETPKGTFEIQPERGDNFFNQGSGEGANYWVSFKDHGIYLFHSVPVDKDGNYNEQEAKELGKSSNSHGCVRLSVSDAKWFYKNIKTGTKVVIE